MNLPAKNLRHLSHYVVLLVLMVSGLVALTLIDKNTFSHTLIIILIGVAYFIWGIIHQALEKELHAETVLEYLLLTLLGLSVVLAVYYYL